MQTLYWAKIEMQIFNLNDNRGVSVIKGFLVQHRRGFICMDVCSPHPPLQCDSLLSLSDMQQRAFTNPHCRTERAWLCILIREGERDRQRGRGREREENRERRTQRCEEQEMKAKKATPPIPTLSHRLHLCSELVIPPGSLKHL